MRNTHKLNVSLIPIALLLLIPLLIIPVNYGRQLRPYPAWLARIFSPLATDITVPAGARLQPAIDMAQAGDTVILDANGIYHGPVTLSRSVHIKSAKTRQVIVRGKSVSVGAQVVTTDTQPAITVLPNVDDVVLEGLDIYATGWVFTIVQVGDGGASQGTLEEVPNGFTLVDSLIHGDPLSDSQRGLAANAANVSVIRSHIYEIHYRGVESQAFAVWNGPGPFLIEDSYLEASGINALFGGALASIPNLIPSDIQIRRSQFFKPLSWKKGDPSFVPIPSPPDAPWLDHWTVKNLLEFKNARNVSVDSCLFENSWADAQTGGAIIFTVRGEGVNQMPWATIQNASFTNNIVRNAGQGIITLGKDDLSASTRASDLRIVNNLFEQISGVFFILSGYSNVTIEHNTHLQGGNIMLLYGDLSSGFVYQNNATVRDPDGFGVFGDATGEGMIALEKFTPGYVFAGNVMAGASASRYPVNNFFPADLSDLESLKGTDGLVPGYSALVTVPSPTPTPSVSPSPSPTITPLPSPTPTSTPTPIPSPSPSPSPSPTPVGPFIGDLRLNVPWRVSEKADDAEARRQRADGFYFYHHQSGKRATFVYTGVKLP